MVADETSTAGDGTTGGSPRGDGEHGQADRTDDPPWIAETTAGWDRTTRDWVVMGLASVVLVAAGVVVEPVRASATTLALYAGGALGFSTLLSPPVRERLPEGSPVQGTLAMASLAGVSVGLGVDPGRALAFVAFFALVSVGTVAVRHLAY